MFETQRGGHCRTTSASVSHRLPIVGIILSLKPLVQHANAIRPPLSIASELVLTTATTPCSFSCFRVCCLKSPKRPRHPVVGDIDPQASVELTSTSAAVSVAVAVPQEGKANQKEFSGVRGEHLLSVCPSVRSTEPID